jgi:hypothetical protein
MSATYFQVFEERVKILKKSFQKVPKYSKSCLRLFTQKQSTSFMVIEKELLDKWKVLWTPGDAEKLVEKFNEAFPEKKGYELAFTRALSQGKCNDLVFKVMADFFEAKADMIKEYL